MTFGEKDFDSSWSAAGQETTNTSRNTGSPSQPLAGNHTRALRWENPNSADGRAVRSRAKKISTPPKHTDSLDWLDFLLSDQPDANCTPVLYLLWVHIFSVADCTRSVGGRYSYGSKITPPDNYRNWISNSLIRTCC